MKSKQQKQQEAQARQAEYDSLSFGDKLKQIIRRPGSSQKELNRLYAMEVRKNGAVTP